ncbi:glycerophosphodiester phosphodiesterase family protein [Serpentinicella sp. ANB-PHB4]|uniref:glycerophosphodiester phosphodiesterase family protein n=1 Tax=Serpentinicella sp. ANB-PHB4 TaxID=3074076 RepID=UPI00286665D4|nr:glycerophosphodiester phosphodiesterase family protein [Serpentinicella sp. ANB-PHB4]MDR5659948.1 glycerophosphodiester phosphodiesterase family protein [Serpentinicella sp. ANB-PHB4]
MKEDMKWLSQMHIAHRGYHFGRRIPENSIAAFVKAMNEGFAIELDLQRLKDNNVVVFHDDNLKRMTGYDKKINECTLDEIRGLKLLDSNDTIPLLSEVLELVGGKVPLMIELKNKGQAGMMEKATEKLLRNYKGQFVIQSFNPFSVSWFRHRAPNIVRGQLFKKYEKGEIAFYKKPFLRMDVSSSMSKPHFINCEISTLENVKNKLIKNKELLLLGWTAKSKTDFIHAKKNCTNVVFEGFDPRES